MSDWTLHTGDCLNVLPTLPDGSVDSVITDPPAGISFMGLEFDSDRGGRLKWVGWLASVLRECLRVAKPGATAVVWALPRTSHWTGCALEEAGWEIFDVVTHLFGQGFPKSLDVGKAIDRAAGAEREVVGEKVYAGGHVQRSNGTDLGRMNDDAWRPTDGRTVTAPATDAARLWDGWHSGLKPAAEFWWLARKPLDGTYAHNALTHGVAGLNVDGTRIPAADGVPLFGNGRREAKTCYADGLGCDGRTGETSHAGRYPANVVLDEEAARLLDEQAGERPSGAGDKHGRKKSLFCASTDWERFKGTSVGGDAGGASRFFYCSKASRRERGEGNTHATVKPLSLMRWLCRLTKTPTGGVVLDPFAGSGTTLLAAVLEGRQAVGVEVSEEYCRIARKRLAEAQGPLFANAGGNP